MITNIKITLLILAVFCGLAFCQAADPNSVADEKLATKQAEASPEQKNRPAEPNSVDNENVDESKNEDADEAEPEINEYNRKCADVLNETYVKDNGFVDYALLRRKRADLYGVTRQFRTIEVEDYLAWELEEQVAFWINVHNLYTLELIINNYPIEPSRWKLIFYPAKSIMQISGARESNYFAVMGREYSLKEIEAIILELYGDPRVLFALNYGAAGSPPLRNEPYNAPMLEKQLDNQVRRFLNRKNACYIEQSTLYLSPIFEWNIDNFVEYYGTDIRYRYHPEQTRAVFNFVEQYKGVSWARILETKRFELEYQKFDWQLNGE